MFRMVLRSPLAVARRAKTVVTMLPAGSHVLQVEIWRKWSGLVRFDKSLHQYPSYSKLLKLSCWEKHQVYSGVDGLLAHGGVP